MRNIPTHLQKKIQKAKEKQLTELDLSNNYWENDNNKRLTEIPSEVFELTQTVSYL
jgi:internalin A